jgi:hypothetical protein
LEGLGKFSHLIDLDFMSELIACLKKLSGYTDHQGEIPPDNALSVSERLQCCIVAFKVWRSNLEALNVDLQDFFVQLYNLILEYRPDRFGHYSYRELFPLLHPFLDNVLLKKLSFNNFWDMCYYIEHNNS